MKKICLFYCGLLPEEKNNLNWLIGQMPELKIIADIDSFVIYNKKTADISPEIWLKLASQIHKKYNEYDGFVILHDLDNLLFTASAISFILQNLTKPIVFCGNQPQSEKIAKDFGFKANLINACQVATYNLPEVALIFGNRLLRANQTSLGNKNYFNIFTAPESGTLGRIDFSIRIFNQTKKINGKLRFYEKISEKIEVIEINPWLNLKKLNQRLENQEAALIKMENQSLPEGLIFLFKNFAKELPIIIYAPGQNLEFKEKNLIIVSNLTFETALAKLSWILGQTKDLKKIKELMAKNIANEIIL